MACGVRRAGGRPADGTDSRRSDLPSYEGLVQVVSDWTQVFDDLVMTAEDFTDVGNKKVLVRVHQRARGAGSGVPMDFDTWFVYTVTSGKIARVEMFNDRCTALEAAGLSE